MARMGEKGNYPIVVIKALLSVQGAPLARAGPKEAWSLEQGWEQVGCGSVPPSNRVAQDTICPLPPFVPRPANDNCLCRDTLQIMAWDTTCKSQH